VFNLFHEIIIIGAGASGMIAALTAKDSGKDVALIDGSNRICKKILITGNGRCNITNTDQNLSRYHSNNSYFFKDILSNFTYKNTFDFFASIGLPLTTQENGKAYPMSFQASSVVDILKIAAEERNIPIYLNSKVKSIIRKNNNFKIICNNQTFKCNKVILCTGGKSAANTGSDGSGFLIAQKLGHNIITPVPSLVQLKLKYNHLKALSGVKFNGECELIVDGKSMRKEYGEILFTDYGISGPPILQVSGIASRNLLYNRDVKLKVDMFPNFSKKQLIDFLENHFGLLGYRSTYSSFIGIINKKIIPIILKEANLSSIHKPTSDLTWNEKKNIYDILKSWTFTVYDTNSFRNSQVTSGGVDTQEINPLTLESKIIPNLYFAGEVVDVDGDCGGFNLQWCWSSGFIAGKSAAKSN
jgi:predicted Rossmann fold flavoprotein